MKEMDLTSMKSMIEECNLIVSKLDTNSDPTSLILVQSHQLLTKNTDLMSQITEIENVSENNRTKEQVNNLSYLLYDLNSNINRIVRLYNEYKT